MYVFLFFFFLFVSHILHDFQKNVYVPKIKLILGDCEDNCEVENGEMKTRSRECTCARRFIVSVVRRTVRTNDTLVWTQRLNMGHTLFSYFLRLSTRFSIYTK